MSTQLLNIWSNKSSVKTYVNNSCVPISVGDLDLNSEVLTWPQRINPVFDQNEELIEASKHAGEKNLLEKKEKVINEFAACV